MLASKLGWVVPRMSTALVVRVLTYLLLEEVNTFSKHSRITGHAELRIQGSASGGSRYLSVHHGRLHWTNALSSHSIKRSTGEIGDFKLAVWKAGSKTADYLWFLDLQGVRIEWVVGFVGEAA